MCGYNFFRNEDSLGPGFYNPKHDIITKNQRMVKIVSKNERKQKSMKQEMETFLNKVMKFGSVNAPEGGEILDYNTSTQQLETDSDLNQYNSIAQITKPREDGVGLS